MPGTPRHQAPRCRTGWPETSGSTGSARCWCGRASVSPPTGSGAGSASGSGRGRAQRLLLAQQPGDDLLRLGAVVRRDAVLHLAAGHLQEVLEPHRVGVDHRVEVQRADRGVDPAVDRDLVAVGADEVLRLGPAPQAVAGAHDQDEHPDQAERQAHAAPARPGRRLRHGVLGFRARVERGRPGRRSGVVQLPVLAVAADRAVHHRGVVAVRHIDDVGDDARHVVRAARAEGQLHQPVRGLVRVRQLQRLQQRVGRDHVGQPVAADQVAVADPGLPDGQVRLHLGAVERVQDQRPLRVRAGLLHGQPALVDQRLDEGVVVGDLAQRAAADQVGPGVADVHQPDPRAGEQQRGEGRAHPIEVRVLLDHRAQVVVRRRGRVPQRGDEVVDRPVLVQVRERGDDHVARHLARRVPAHAVGQRQQPWPGVHRVLVVGAHQPAVGPHRVPEGHGHRARPGPGGTFMTSTREPSCRSGWGLRAGSASGW